MAAAGSAGAPAGALFPARFEKAAQKVMGNQKDHVGSRRRPGGEALVTFLRIRDANRMWGCALHYERRGESIKWLQEVAGELNVNDIEMIPRWY